MVDVLYERPTGGCTPPSAVGLAQRALHIALRLALLDRLALVEAVLATGEGDLHLGARAPEVDPRGHERQAALLRLADEALDLAAVGQQLARALGVVVLARRRAVGRDVDVVQPQLAVADRRVPVLELRRAAAQRLHLRAGEHDAALELVEQVEPVRRLPVRRDVARRRLPLALALGHPDLRVVRRRLRRPVHEVQIHAAAWRLDALHADPDRVAEADRGAGVDPEEDRPRLVELPPVAAQAAHGKQPLVAVAEAHERACADDAGDLALELPPPALLEELALEQEAARDRVGRPLDAHRVALAGARPLARLVERAGARGVLAPAHRAQQRAVAD